MAFKVPSILRAILWPHRFGEDILCNTWRRRVVFHAAVNVCTSPLGTQVPFSAAVMCWGWGTVAVWRLCTESYPPAHGLWSMQMAGAVLGLAVSMSGPREPHKAHRVYPNPYQLLLSYGKLMDNNNGLIVDLPASQGHGIVLAVVSMFTRQQLFLIQ